MVTGFATIKDAAIALGVTERWLQILCKQGKVPGATRFNNQGAWLIPTAWIKTEQEKRTNATIIRNEESTMKKIAFVFDDVSEKTGEEVFSRLEKNGASFYSKGVISIYAHADESTIVSSLFSIIHDADMVIGVSSSGNGIAIYTNKISGFTAAPISSISDIDDAIDVYKANAFDIPAHSAQLFSICANLVERVNRTNEME